MGNASRGYFQWINTELAAPRVHKIYAGFCCSPQCCKIKEQELTTYRREIEKTRNKDETFCADCGYALYWKPVGVKCYARPKRG